MSKLILKFIISLNLQIYLYVFIFLYLYFIIETGQMIRNTGQKKIK